MRPSKEVEEKLFKEINEHKNSKEQAKDGDIETLYHIMLHDLGSEEANKILNDAGFYDHLNVDCKLDYEKWIYVDKKNRSGAGKNSFHDVSWKLLYEMKDFYEEALKNKSKS